MKTIPSQLLFIGSNEEIEMTLQVAEKIRTNLKRHIRNGKVKYKNNLNELDEMIVIGQRTISLAS